MTAQNKRTELCLRLKKTTAAGEVPFGLAGFDSRGSHSKKAPFAILKESALLLLATGLLPRRWPLQRQRQRQRLAVANNYGTERPHAAACEIAGDVGPKFSKSFRGHTC